MGATQQFTATGHFSDGGSAAVAVTWSATGGTVSASGLFTAGPVPGTFRWSRPSRVARSAARRRDRHRRATGAHEHHGITRDRIARPDGQAAVHGHRALQRRRHRERGGELDRHRRDGLVRALHRRCDGWVVSGHGHGDGKRHRRQCRRHDHPTSESRRDRDLTEHPRAPQAIPEYRPVFGNRAAERRWHDAGRRRLDDDERPSSGNCAVQRDRR